MTMKMKKVAGLVATLVTVALSLSAPVAAGDEARGRWNAKLNGTWKVTVTMYNCQTGTAGTPFVSLLSYAEGGTMTETTANPVFQPGQRSIGLGSWMQTGRNAYWSTTRAFILFDSPAPPPVQQFSTGEQQIDQGIRMTGHNSWTSEAKMTLTRTDGSEYFSGCARAVATRVE